MSIKFNAGENDFTDSSSPAKGAGWGFNTSKRPTAMDENNIKIKGHIMGPQTV